MLTSYCVWWLTVLCVKDATGLIFHDINMYGDFSQRIGVYCSGEPPSVHRSGGEKEGWYTYIGCGYPTGLLHSTPPGGCYDAKNEKYRKPVVSIEPQEDKSYFVRVTCDGDAVGDKVS